MENVRKYKNIKLVTTKRKRNYIVSESNYYTKSFFKENLLEIEMKKINNNDFACSFTFISIRSE